MPAEAAGGFHHQALPASGGQHAFAVGGILLFEQVDTGHRHHTHVLTVGAQLGSGLHAKVELGAGADQDQIGSAVAVFQDVAALGHVVSVGVGLVGHRLTAEEHQGTGTRTRQKRGYAITGRQRPDRLLRFATLEAPVPLPGETPHPEASRRAHAPSHPQAPSSIDRLSAVPASRAQPLRW